MDPTQTICKVENTNAAYINFDRDKKVKEEQDIEDRKNKARENHKEIEKRRRKKMSLYYKELSKLLDIVNRRPDKITITKEAIIHMQNLPGQTSTYNSDTAYKPQFLTDQELKHLILEVDDAFLFVAQCDTGNLIYVSDAVQPVLSYAPAEWTHRSLFDFIHPDDLGSVKDQISTRRIANISNSSSGHALGSTTDTMKKEENMISMITFICRIKNGNIVHENERQFETPWSTDLMLQNQPVYSVVHIAGNYIEICPQNNFESAQSFTGNLIALVYCCS
jgi:PAS domain-containing protein